AQQVVADAFVDGPLELVARRLLRNGALELAVLPLPHPPMAELIEGPVLRGGRQPGSRIVGNAGLRPLLERFEERVLRQVLGRAHVAHETRQAANQTGRLDAERSLD